MRQLTRTCMEELHPEAFRNTSPLPFRSYFICLFVSFVMYVSKVAVPGNQVLVRRHCPHYNSCIFRKANNPSLPPPISPTPRASLSSSSYCPVISSCCRDVLPPCDTLTIIGVAFPIAPRLLNRQRGARALAASARRLAVKKLVIS